MVIFQQTHHLITKVYDTTLDIFSDVKNINAARINKLCSLDGIDNIVNVSIPILRLLTHFKSNAFDHWLSVSRGQRDLYQTFLIFPSTLKFSSKPTVGNFLSLMEFASKSCQFLYKCDVFQFNSWQAFTQKIGQFKIFHYGISKRCLDTPRDLFILLTSIWELSTIAMRHCHSDRRKLLHMTLQIEEKYKNKTDLLDLIYHTGRIALVIFRSYTNKIHLEKMGYLGVIYSFIEIGANSASLTKLIIRKNGNA